MLFSVKTLVRFATASLSDFVWIVFAAESFDDYEVIIINDGSTDDSGSICREIKLMGNLFSVIMPVKIES